MIPPKKISLKELAYYLDAFIDPQNIDDTAFNGIQVANSTSISKIATAVTASIETIERVAQAGAHALIVHHGIFKKKGMGPILGNVYKKLRLLIKYDIALLCYHLPLDAHQEIGNNWKAAKDLGLYNLQPFAKYGPFHIGVIGEIDSLGFADFQKKVESYYENTAHAIKVKDPIQKIVIVSGAGEKSIRDAANAGADCFITGRVDEPVWDAAHEDNISFLGLGHYTSEIVGVKALSDHLRNALEIESIFIKTQNPF